MNCVKCDFEVSNSRQPGIHDLCLVVLQQFHDSILFTVFPTIFSGKGLVRAQGLAIECNRCYRLAVPTDVWYGLPRPLAKEILVYNTDVREPLCANCHAKAKAHARAKLRRPPLNGYRRNADTQLRQAERNFQQEPTRDRWVVWLREAARAGSYPFTPEGVASATGGSLASFEMIEDGFEARVEDAQFPALEVAYRYRTGPDADDFESDSYPRGLFNAKISVRWHPSYDDNPGLYIEIDAKQEEELVRMPMGAEGIDFTRMNTTPGGDYHYVGNSVQNDAQLVTACRTPKAWDSC